MSYLFSAFVPWLFNVLYLVLLLAGSPWIVYAALKHGKYREGFGERFFGRVPSSPADRPTIWFHAVSVGEVNLIGTLLQEIHERFPDWQLVISTTTKTGYALATEKYSDYSVFYAPLDFSWAVKTALRRVQPDLLVLAELELWPNWIDATKRSGARVAIINGRLSDSSFRGYSRVRSLVAAILKKIDLIAAQNPEVAGRFRRLGAPSQIVHVTGSLKYDGAQADRSNLRTRELKELARIEPSDVVWVAGSTQHPEEAIVLKIFCELCVEFPHLRLVLVPRHPERFNEVARLLDVSGLPWERRSEWKESSNLGNPNKSPSILLVDTIGELGAWWGTANIGFVGGTFGSRGGQNMIEPAAYGVATSFGPNTRNFRDIVTQLVAANAAQVLQDPQALAQFVRRSLKDPDWAEQLGARARRFVASQQGATLRTLELIDPLIAIESKTDCSAAA